MKKSFTLLELLIVVIIIWMLILAMKKIFSYKNIDFLMYDTCYLNINWKLDNFFQQAILQKSIYTWDKWEKVDEYNVFFNVNNQKIDFVYSWSFWQFSKSISLTWDWFDRKTYCFSPSYHTKLSWQNLKISIKPWLQIDNNAFWDAWIVLFTWDSFSNKITNWTTWWVSFYYCEWNWCFERDKIIIDTKVNLIKKFFCKKKNENTCISWSE